MQYSTNPNPVFYGGMQYNPQQFAPQMAKQNNNLSAEEIQKLQKTEAFSLRMNEDERLRSACNHRSANGETDTLIPNADGSYSCAICGARFDTIEPTVSEEDIQDAVQRVLDILQTSKLLYINMPTEAAREYYQIIPLIERIPKLFKLAAETYRKYESSSTWNFNNRGMGTVNLFNMLTGGQPNVYQPTFDQFGNPIQQPYYQQPMQAATPMQGVPVGAAAPGVNPFVGQPMPQPQMAQPYQPGMTGYQYQPGMTAPMPAPQPVYPTAPTAPAPGTSTDQQAPAGAPADAQKVQVATTIKA